MQANRQAAEQPVRRVLRLHVLRLFFSSRRRHTRYWPDWSSDVCSSDLTTKTKRFTQRRQAAEEECPHDWGHGSLEGYATADPPPWYSPRKPAPRHALPPLPGPPPPPRRAPAGTTSPPPLSGPSEPAAIPPASASTGRPASSARYSV